jgi:hypothetical protein
VAVESRILPLKPELAAGCGLAPLSRLWALVSRFVHSHFTIKPMVLASAMLAEANMAYTPI